MVRLSWLSFLGQFRKHLYVALIFGIDLAQPLILLKRPHVLYIFGKIMTFGMLWWALYDGGLSLGCN